MNIGVRVAAGITTGALAVLVAQPTDVVKVRMQAGNNGRSSVRYSSTLQAYKNIANVEGARGLWKGNKEGLYYFFLSFCHSQNSRGNCNKKKKKNFLIVDIYLFRR